jgi:nitroreductase
MPEIALFDAIYSARALRRLKPDPVPEEIITRILDAAIRAPSAGNAQNWAFITGHSSWCAMASNGADWA